MRRIVVHGPGGYDRLLVENHPDPEPAAGEVRLRVKAVGINYADCVVRMGLYASAKKYVGWPITPGFEVAGDIDALGPGVTGFSTGDAVLGVTRFGGYATSVCIPAHQVFAIPPSWSMEEAAAFPSVHLTAWYALHRLAHVADGERILVHSAGGGVGSALVRLGVIAGCHVIGVVGSSHKIEHVESCGAHAVIDASREDIFERAGPVDVVLDANGAKTLRRSYAALRPAGRLVVYGFHSMLPRRGGVPSWARLAFDWLRMPRFNPLDMTGDNRSVMAFNLSYLFDETRFLQDGMTSLLDHVRAGRLPPPRVQVFPFDDVAKAHAALESGATIGKLVLKP